MIVIADTGFWLALANKKDDYHAQAVKFYRDTDCEYISTWPVVAETFHLIVYRMGVLATSLFLDFLESGECKLFDIQLAHLKRIRVLMKKYRDLPMDLADASLLLLAEELGQGKIVSTDQRDLRTYRWKEKHPFENLLLAPS